MKTVGEPASSKTSLFKIDSQPGILFSDNPVGPLDQRHENCRVPELCAPILQVCFRDPTGPGTGSSSEDGNVFGDDLVAQFAERRPTHGKYSCRGGVAHQIRSFAGKKNLNLMAGIG